MAASRLRTLLVLGRVSNLPTVWSNCLAAWLLSGGGPGGRFALLLASGSCLYVGGMFLNDVCDAEFDRRQRSERPIPSCQISRGAVCTWAVGLFLAGTLLAAGLGSRVLVFALALLAAIIAYDVWHKRQPITLGLMAGCRLLLYLLAGIAAAGKVTDRLVVGGAGIAVYVLAISLLARHEGGKSRSPKWPILLLGLPYATALYNHPASALTLVLFVMIPFSAWLAAALSLLWRPEPEIGCVVSRLLAGLVLADWLQVAGLAQDWPDTAAFAALFGATLLLQRRVPAT